MPNNTNCPLCSAAGKIIHDDRGAVFFKCQGCLSVFRNPSDTLSPEQEKNRYELHNNNPIDPDYRTFVSPMINKVLELFTPTHHGIDFGAGPVPVITKLLQEKGYKIESYDLFFHNDPKLLEKTYDYIVACEVIEHFGSPAKEFKLLRSQLKPSGALICMTGIYKEETDFSKWHYKNDKTHRFFYSPQSLEWIRNNFGFSSMDINGRLVSFYCK